MNSPYLRAERIGRRPGVAGATTSRRPARPDELSPGRYSSPASLRIGSTGRNPAANPDRLIDVAPAAHVNSGSSLPGPLGVSVVLTTNPTDMSLACVDVGTP